MAHQEINDDPLFDLTLDEVKPPEEPALPDSKVEIKHMGVTVDLVRNVAHAKYAKDSPGYEVLQYEGDQKRFITRGPAPIMRGNRMRVVKRKGDS